MAKFAEYINEMVMQIAIWLIQRETFYTFFILFNNSQLKSEKFYWNFINSLRRIELSIKVSRLKVSIAHLSASANSRENFYYCR